MSRLDESGINIATRGMVILHSLRFNRGGIGTYDLKVWLSR